MAGGKAEEIIEERTASATASGIEHERPEAAGPAGAGEPFDPEKIEIQTRGLTIDALLKRIRAKTIDAGPDFAGRDDIWTGARRGRLIESLLLKIPLPAVYAAEDAAENWAVVDGGQRLIAIAQFVDADAIGRQPLGLSGLEYLGGDFDGMTFDRLPARLQRRLRETELEVHVIRHGTPEAVKFNIATRVNGAGMPLSAQELRHALTPGPARDVLAGWSQLPEFRKATANSLSGAQMTDRELVLRFVAFRLTPAEAYDAADFDQFLGEAMRALNVMPEKPEPAPEPEPEPEPEEPAADDGADAAPDIDAEPGPEDGFEPEAPPVQEPEPEPEPEPMTLERLEAEFRAAMTAAHAIFGDDAFRKRFAPDDPPNPINKALFEAVSVTLADLDAGEREILVAQKQSVSKLFMELMHNSTFEKAVSQGTGDAAKIGTRFAAVAKIIKKALE